MTKDALTVPLLKAADVAKLLGVCESTVYEWSEIDYIPHFRLGPGDKKQCVRFDKEDVLQWIKERKSAGRLRRVPA